MCRYERVGELRLRCLAPRGLSPDRIEVLLAVADTIERRKRGEGMTNTDGRSYVRGLLDGAPLTINDKITEEARRRGGASAWGDPNSKHHNAASGLGRPGRGARPTEQSSRRPP